MQFANAMWSTMADVDFHEFTIVQALSICRVPILAWNFQCWLWNSLEYSNTEKVCELFL